MRCVGWNSIPSLDYHSRQLSRICKPYKRQFGRLKSTTRTHAGPSFQRPYRTRARSSRGALARIIDTLDGHKAGWGLGYWFRSDNSFLGGKRPQEMHAFTRHGNRPHSSRLAHRSRACVIAPERSAAPPGHRATLSRDESDKLLGIATVVAYAIYVFGGKARALRWLRTAPCTRACAPMALAQTTRAVRCLVLRLLRIDEGYLA